MTAGAAADAAILSLFSSITDSTDTYFLMRLYHSMDSVQLFSIQPRIPINLDAFTHLYHSWNNIPLLNTK